MHAEVAARGAPDRIDPAASAAAMLNILSDFGEERDRLRDAQRAVLNIVEDATDERTRAETALTATVNILEDLDAERRAAADLQQAMLNVLDDFDAEKQRVEQANRDLDAAASELVQANAQLEAFSYSVAHDLRAPLRAIDGFSRILVEEQADRLDDEGRRVLGIVTESVRQMAALIDDLLSFSRIGRAVLEPQLIDMGELARSVADDLLAGESDRTIDLGIGPLGAIEGDPATLRQAWVNLVSNALKFTRHRRVARIRIARKSQPGEVVYSIADNGAGFDMRYVDKLFGVFQRLHATQEFEGTGIGLAIVARVVDRHDGRVWAKGTVGRGATFFMALPRGSVAQRG